MQNIDDNSLENWKESFAKDGIVYNSDQEYREAIKNFTGFIELLIKVDSESKKLPTGSRSGKQDKYVLDRNGN